MNKWIYTWRNKYTNLYVWIFQIHFIKTITKVVMYAMGSKWSQKTRPAKNKMTFTKLSAHWMTAISEESAESQWQCTTGNKSVLRKCESVKPQDVLEYSAITGHPQYYAVCCCKRERLPWTDREMHTRSQAHVLTQTSDSVNLRVVIIICCVMLSECNGVFAPWVFV